MTCQRFLSSAISVIICFLAIFHRVSPPQLLSASISLSIYCNIMQNLSCGLICISPLHMSIPSQPVLSEVRTSLTNNSLGLWRPLGNNVIETRSTSGAYIFIYCKKMRGICFNSKMPRNVAKAGTQPMDQQRRRRRRRLHNNYCQVPTYETQSLSKVSDDDEIVEVCLPLNVT